MFVAIIPRAKPINRMPKKDKIAKVSEHKINVVVFFPEIVNRNYFTLPFTPLTLKMCLDYHDNLLQKLTQLIKILKPSAQTLVPAYR